MAYTAFDRIVAWLRFRAALPHIQRQSNVCDIGCGLDAEFLRRIAPRARIAVGLDKQLMAGNSRGVPIVYADIAAGLPVRSGYFDHAVMLAVLEHLTDPERTLGEAHRILKPGGTLIISWPSAAVDPLLDVLHHIGIVSNEMESGEHQPRIPRPALLDLLRRIGFDRFVYRRFEFGLNNLLVAHKAGA